MVCIIYGEREREGKGEGEGEEEEEGEGEGEGGGREKKGERESDREEGKILFLHWLSVILTHQQLLGGKNYHSLDILVPFSIMLTILSCLIAIAETIVPHVWQWPNDQGEV